MAKWGQSSGGTSSKEPACQCRRHKRRGLDPQVGKIPWRREWQPTSSILAWRIPGTEGPGGLQCMGSHWVGHDWATWRARLPTGPLLIGESVWLNSSPSLGSTFPGLVSVFGHVTLACDVTQGLTVLCIWLCSLAPLLTCLGRLTGLREGMRYLGQPTPVGLTLCNPMDYSPPGSSIHGILQARILEWVAMPSSRGSSQPRDQTLVSLIVGRHFTVWATREVPLGPTGPQGERNAVLGHLILKSLVKQPFGGFG